MSTSREAPIVSAVIPNRNYARFVVRAVESLLAQSLPEGALEVIVIDDASTDDSWERLQRFRDDRRVILVRHEQNVGYIRTYNEGMAMATGRYVVSLDADDFAIDPDALRAEAEALDRHPGAGLVGSDHVIVDDDERRLGYKRARVPSRLSGAAAFRRLMRENFITHSGAMVRRDVLTAVGPHDARFFHSMDRELWLRVAARYDVLHVPRPLFAYRLHRLNMHRAVDPDLGLRALEDVLEEARRYSPLPDTDDVVRRSLARGHLQRAAMWFERGRFAAGFADVRAAARGHPLSLASRDTARAVARLAARSVLGHRSESLATSLRRRLYDREPR